MLIGIVIMEIDDPMRFESHRLQTFRRLKWPSWSLISCEKLAKAGFYYAGLGDEVICYSCGGKRRGWKMGEKAIGIHSAMFPLCAFVRKDPECGNVPLTNFRANTTATTNAIPPAPNPLPQAAAVESDLIEIAAEETVGAEVETAAEAMEVGSQLVEESVISEPTDYQYDVDVSDGPGPSRMASTAANSLSHDGISSSPSSSNDVSSSPNLISFDSDVEFESAGTRYQAMISRRPKRPMAEPGGVTPIRRPTPVAPPVVPQVSTPTFDRSPNPNFQQSVGRVTEQYETADVPQVSTRPSEPNANFQLSVRRVTEPHETASSTLTREPKIPNANFQRSVRRVTERDETADVPQVSTRTSEPNANFQRSLLRVAERDDTARRLQTARRGRGRMSSSWVAESEMAPTSDRPESVGSPRATHRVPIGEWPEPTSFPHPIPPSLFPAWEEQFHAATRAHFRRVFGSGVASMQRDPVAPEVSVWDETEAEPSPRRPHFPRRGGRVAADSEGEQERRNIFGRIEGLASVLRVGRSVQEIPEDIRKQLDDMNIYTDVPRRPDMASYSCRLQTFTNIWPMDKTQQPSDMASAGFYCTGDSDSPDGVKCFHCGVTLHNWLVMDDPWVEHVRWSERCQFILINKGKQFWESVKIRYKRDSQSTSVSVENRHSAAAATTTAVTKANSAGPQTFSDLASSGREQTNIPPIFDPLAEQITQALSFGYEEKTIVGAIADNGSQLFPSVLELIDRIEAIRVRQENFPSTSSQWNGNSTPNFTSLSEENRYLKEQRICKICMDNEVSVVFLPCGHLVSCPQCASALQLCPICREKVRGSVRSFVA